MPKGIKGFQKGHPFYGDLSKPNYFQRGVKFGPMPDSQRKNLSKALTGKPKSEIHKLHLIENHRKFNSKEHNEKISKALMGHIVSDKTKQKISVGNNGKHHVPWNKNLTKETDERVKKISENQIGRHLSDEHKLHLKQNHKGMSGMHHTEEAKQKNRLARFKIIIPTKDTKIEVLMQNKLKENGIEFIKHPSIENFCQPDLQMKGTKILIFCDGCFWHGCEQCYDKNFFNKQSPIFSKIRKTKINDILITQYLINDGYIVLRFWEHEINNDMESVMNRILECYNKTIRNPETPNDGLVVIK